MVKRILSVLLFILLSVCNSGKSGEDAMKFNFESLQDENLMGGSSYFMENGALVIQAHPFREASYIDHIRLFPRCIHGVEVINAGRTEEENKMARIYAEHYGLIEFAGTDNHIGKKQKSLAGMCSEKAVMNEQDFICRVKNNEMTTFTTLSIG